MVEGAFLFNCGGRQSFFLIRIHAGRNFEAATSQKERPEQMNVPAVRKSKAAKDYGPPVWQSVQEMS